MWKQKAKFEKKKQHKFRFLRFLTDQLSFVACPARDSNGFRTFSYLLDKKCDYRFENWFLENCRNLNLLLFLELGAITEFDKITLFSLKFTFNCTSFVSFSSKLERRLTNQPFQRLLICDLPLTVLFTAWIYMVQSDLISVVAPKIYETVSHFLMICKYGPSLPRSEIYFYFGHPRERHFSAVAARRRHDTCCSGAYCDENIKWSHLQTPFGCIHKSYEFIAKVLVQNAIVLYNDTSWVWGEIRSAPYGLWPPRNANYRPAGI